MTSDDFKTEGVAFAQKNQLMDAQRSFEQALALSPTDATIYSNLGIVLSSLGQVQASLAAFKQAIALKPDFTTAYLNLGLTQLEYGQPAAAADNFLMVIALDAGSYQAHYMLSTAYFQLRQYYLALAAIESALAFNPHDVSALHNQSSIYTMLGDQEKSVQALHQILQIDPNHPTARYHLAKYGQADMPSTAPANYVADLFNDYAATFDEQLVDKLNYQAPQQIAAIVQRLDFGIRLIRALDLGAGTGLVAQTIANPEINWIGVDLSQKMIDVAIQKNLYAELHLTTIDDYLAKPHAPFQLITAADVFIYVGEVSGVFQRVQTQLADNGWFVFSVENHEETTIDTPSPSPAFVLRMSGRYAHSDAYLRHLAAVNGFRVAMVQPHVLRLEGSTPIAGSTWALQKINH